MRPVTGLTVVIGEYEAQAYVHRLFRHADHNPIEKLSPVCAAYVFHAGALKRKSAQSETERAQRAACK